MDADDLIGGLLISALKNKAERGSKRTQARHGLSVEELAHSYLSKHTFKVGDRVTLKEGMDGLHKYPKGDDTCVVLETVKEPIRNQYEKHTGTPFWNMPFDIRVGLLDEDGDFVAFWFDSAMFEPAREKDNTIKFPRRKK